MHQRIPLFSSRWRSQVTNPQISSAPAATTNGVNEKPNGDRRVVRMQPSPVARLQHARDEQPEPEGRQHAADVVEPALRRRARRQLGS